MEVPFLVLRALYINGSLLPRCLAAMGYHMVLGAWWRAWLCWDDAASMVAASRCALLGAESAAAAVVVWLALSAVGARAISDGLALAPLVIWLALAPLFGNLALALYISYCLARYRHGVYYTKRDWVFEF